MKLADGRGLAGNLWHKWQPFYSQITGVCLSVSLVLKSNEVTGYYKYGCCNICPVII